MKKLAVKFLTKTITAIIVLLIVYFVQVSLTAQTTNKKDSLLSALKTSKVDTNTVNILAQLCKKYSLTKPEKSIYFGEKGIMLAQKLDYKKGLADCYFNIASTYYFMKIDNNKALSFANKAFEIFLTKKNYKKAIKCYKNTGLILFSLGEYEHALNRFYISIKMSETFVFPELLPEIYCSIGLLYFYIKDDEKALKNFYIALDLTDENEKRNIGIYKNNIGSVYTKMQGGNENKALKYLQESIIISEELLDTISIARTLINVGLNYESKQEYSEAIKYYNKSLKLMQNFNDYEIQFKANTSISNIYLKQNDYHSALKYAKAALKSIENIKSIPQKQDAYFIIYEIHNKINDYETALKYYRLYTDLNDSIHATESQNKILELEAKYQNEIKEKNIAELKKEKQIKELEISKQKKIKTFFIVTGLLSFLVLVIVIAFFIQRKKLNKKLSYANKQLIEINASKDRFFTIISHDIQNPLNAFRSITKELSDSYYKMSEEAKYSYITEVYKSSEHLYKLFKNLLQWSITQSKNIKYNPKEIDISILIYKTISKLEQTAGKKGINIISELSDSIYVKADINMISTVIFNLISNAVKFSGVGQNIIVSAVKDDNKVTISVKDNGIGISEADIKKLFCIEHDQKTIGNSKEKGSGIGLILCKELIEINGGEIWAESLEGNGSNFNFTLPLS